ncbi:fibrobacter succinogenes major paralogous domain-containing protein [bacterium]|nr:fibrobacter succinogenes major paralogous domain-containing protein [bacterium]
MKTFYAILCIAIASLTQLQAQAPQGFNYQATVRNSSGDLIVNTNVYFKFNVIQGSQTAVPIFTETHYVPTDDLGQVNLVIGEGTANTGVFSELDWSLGSYYLGIELDTGNGYVAMGTTQLLSVPYALYAESSGNSTPTTPTLQSVLTENNSAGQQQIKDLLEPTDGADAATKAYVDALSNTQGLMNFNGWDNYQVWSDNSTFTLTPNSFVFINANNTTLVFPDGPENCCFGDVIYVYVMDGDPLTPTIFNLQANGFPVAVGGGDEQLVWTSSEVISGAFNTVGLKTIINVGDYWMVADFQGSISNNLTAQVNPVSNIVVCHGSDVPQVDFSTTNNQGTTQYYWTNDNGSIGIPTSGVNDFGGLGVSNTTTVPQVSNITVTPELTFQGQTTTGPSEMFTITVNPEAQVDPIADITVNSGETVQPINFTIYNTSGTTTYSWTNSTPSLGLGSSGSGNIPAFTASNTSAIPIVGTITVTPTFTNGGVSCTGPSISFTITVNPAAGSITDQDGNTYDYLYYGDQVWTVENAQMVTYRDGTPIPQVTSNGVWEDTTTGAWCYYNNDPAKGKLYNWYAVMGIHDTDPNTPNKEFAPEGWHVPSDAEWTTLENHLIANGYNYDGTTTGNKIAKAMASTTGWYSSTEAGAIGNDQSSNNNSNFNAFPEGNRLLNGSFNNEGSNAIFWSSTEYNTNYAWYRYLFNNNSTLNRIYYYKRYGFSVRFVRD